MLVVLTVERAIAMQDQVPGGVPTFRPFGVRHGIKPEHKRIRVIPVHDGAAARRVDIFPVRRYDRPKVPVRQLSAFTAAVGRT